MTKNEKSVQIVQIIAKHAFVISPSIDIIEAKISPLLVYICYLMNAFRVEMKQEMQCMLALFVFFVAVRAGIHINF